MCDIVITSVQNRRNDDIKTPRYKRLQKRAVVRMTNKKCESQKQKNEHFIDDNDVKKMDLLLFTLLALCRRGLVFFSGVGRH